MRFFNFFLLFSLLFHGCSNEEQNSGTFTAQHFLLEDSKLASFHVKKVGNNITIKEHPGKVIIFDIFATWCPACKVIAPHLDTLQNKYKDKLLVIGLSIEQGKDHAFFDNFAEAHKAFYPISNSEDNTPLIQRIAVDLRQPRSFPIPLIVMYDPQGNYFRHYTGAVPQEIIDRDIASALGEP